LIAFHIEHGKIATLSAVNPVSTFGILDLGTDSSVLQFREKPQLENWINGGFFVFENSVFGYLDGDSTLEREPLSRLASERQLMAYRHRGFWKCMDTYKDHLELNHLWENGAPWKTW
jgi:glucose-1-phosphate cytidylyltransferase